MVNEVTIAEPSRLMTLLNDCIKWQQQQGLLSYGEPLDLLRSSNKVQSIEQDIFANHGYASIKVNNNLLSISNFILLSSFSSLERTHTLSVRHFLQMDSILQQVQ